MLKRILGVVLTLLVLTVVVMAVAESKSLRAARRAAVEFREGVDSTGAMSLPDSLTPLAGPEAQPSSAGSVRR